MAKKQFDAGFLGTFLFYKVDNVKSWHGWVKLDEFNNGIGLSIETSTETPPSSECLKSIQEFLASYSRLKSRLLNHIHNAYQQTEYAFPVEQLDQMYFLSSITLKDDGDWWVVLEPGDVDTLINHFIRFTVRDGDIVWANI